MDQAQLFELISDVEKGKIELSTDFEVIRKENLGGANEHFIKHRLAFPNEDSFETLIEFTFREKPHIREMNEAIYQASINPNIAELKKLKKEFDKMPINDLSDEYDYDTVAFYDIGDVTGIRFM